jgi:hypothetical protein
MLNCKKCKGRLFVDRVFTSHDHLETFCIICGGRNIYHPPSKFERNIQWLHQNELKRMMVWNGR